MDTARKRIIDFIENQGIKPHDFLEKTSLKKGFVDRSHQYSGASDIYLSKILESYPEISAEWLLTGKGEMLKEEGRTIESTSIQVQEPYNRIVELLEATIKDKETIIKDKDKIIAGLEQDKTVLQSSLNDKDKIITGLEAKLKKLSKKQVSKESKQDVQDLGTGVQKQLKE